MKTHIQEVQRIYKQAESHVSEILQKADVKKEDEIVLAYGRTGAGKSFLCHFMNSEQVVVGEYNGRPVLEFKSELATRDVGHSFKSKTLMPKILGTEGNKHFVDCPGSESTLGVYDQINQRVVINELLSKINCRKKILLAIEYSELSETGGQTFLKHMDELRAVPNLLESVTMLFTKVPKHIDIVGEVQKVVKDRAIEEGISPILKGNRLLAFPKAEHNELGEEYNNYTMRDSIIKAIDGSPWLDVDILHLPIDSSGFSQIASEFKQHIKALVTDCVKGVNDFTICKVKATYTKEEFSKFVEKLEALSKFDDFIGFANGCAKIIELDTRELQKALSIFKQLSFYDGRGDYSFEQTDYGYLRDNINTIIRKVYHLKVELPPVPSQEEIIIYGHFLTTSEMNKVLKKADDFTTIKVYASASVYFDADITLPGKNLVIISPK